MRHKTVTIPRQVLKQGHWADGPRSSRPKRRTFTAAYKLAMIEKYDMATEPGAKGALLRGEGLYDSHISYWRKARDSGSIIQNPT